MPASQASQSDFEVGVVVQALPNRNRENTTVPVFSAAANGTMSVVSSGGVDPEPGTGPANQAPVARFFARVDPAVEGQPIDLDARESFDRDGTIAPVRVGSERRRQLREDRERPADEGR